MSDYTDLDEDNFDEEVLETAKEHDLGPDEAEELQELVNDTGLDAEDAIELLM